MQQIPIYAHVVFILTTVVALCLFCAAFQKSKAGLFVLIAWAAIQSVPALNGFFTVTDTMPPRFVLLVLPPLLTAVFLFTTKKGKRFMDTSDLKMLTLIHTLRIPVELTLYWLFLSKALPELMTFHGRNLDILSGMTAPFIFYFGFVKKQLSGKILLGWNILCLLILLFTVVNGILSAPTPFQQFAFDQPNRAVLYFPFVWLPGIVVPIVYTAHLISIRSLLRQTKSKPAALAAA